MPTLVHFKVVKVCFKNLMQEGEYERTRLPGGISDFPDFKPFHTPQEMLALGVFEGKYLNSCQDEYPVAWFKSAKLSSVPDETVNRFGLKSRLPTSWWREKKLINEQDPRGWFEWYCRFWMGRRTVDDARQVKRWKQIARHSAQVKKHGYGDESIRKKQRQTLLQWAWNPFPDVK